MNALTTKLALSAAKSSASSYAKKAQKELGLDEEDEKKSKDDDWFGSKKKQQKKEQEEEDLKYSSKEQKRQEQKKKNDEEWSKIRQKYNIPSNRDSSWNSKLKKQHKESIEDMPESSNSESERDPLTGKKKKKCCVCTIV